MSIQQAYTHWSESYDQDRNLTRDLDQVVSQKALGNLHFKSILEIGCGTGKNTALLAQIGEKVHALDFSEGMLQKAKEKLQSDHVTFSIADLTQPWPCEGQWAELVVCNLVLEHIEDLSFIFSEASRTLMEDGRFFISELHPFRQYQGTKANFQRDQDKTEIQAFVHHLSAFIHAAKNNGLTLEDCGEWWHEEDQAKPPRLVSFMFRKRSQS
jgi:ubiquinone/menaquinone biosynthesis C-methylase UbiE